MVVPSQRQALHKQESPFSKSHFIYNKEQDGYICPEGHRLNYRSTYRKNGKRTYKIEKAGLCRNCPHFGQCTRSKEGRKLVRLRKEEVKQRLEAQYKTPFSQKIYARRKEKAEHPFGHIKRNLKVSGFLMRGLKGVHAETSILGTCFNIARMRTILGSALLIRQLKLLSIPDTV